MGPLYQTCYCFALEALLGLMKRFVLGPNNACKKITDSFQIVHNMPKFERVLEKDSKAAMIVNKIKYDTAKKIAITPTVFILGSILPIKQTSEFLINAIGEFDCISLRSPAQKWWKFYKLQTERCTVVSNSYSNARFYDSLLIITKDGTLFRVELFVMYKKCNCSISCECEMFYRALGYFCDRMSLQNCHPHHILCKYWFTRRRSITSNKWNTWFVCSDEHRRKLVLCRKIELSRKWINK